MELREGMERSATEYVLHPGMVDRALEAGRKVMEGEGEREACSWKVEGVEKVRIVSGCVEQMWAWVRYAGEVREEMGWRRWTWICAIEPGRYAWRCEE